MKLILRFLHWFRIKKFQKRFSKTHIPLSLQNYGKKFSSHPLDRKSKKGRSPGIRYVIFDTETTGLDPYTDRLLSIGAVAVKGNTISLNDSFYRVTQIHSNDLSKSNIYIHGILPGESLEGSSVDEAIFGFLDFIGDSILVCHHAGFDITLINNILNKNYGCRLLNWTLDTVQLAKNIHTGMNRSETNFNYDCSLESLCKEFNIATEGRHNSWGDAMITAELFLKLTAKAIRMGWKNWMDWGVK